MKSTTVLISPLNWGFGHAGRMIPLAMELKRRGNEVVFGADAGLLPVIEGELPGIKLIEIPGLHIRYSRILPQYVCIFMQLPKVILSAVREHSLLKRLAAEIKPDVIISDNRFGFYHSKIFSVYVTHQIRLPFPRLLRSLEPIAAWLHRKIINRYNLCLVPDYPGPVNLSGRLSHDLKVPGNVHYIGPLSRFAGDAGMDPLLQSLETAATRPLSQFEATAETRPLSQFVPPAATRPLSQFVATAETRPLSHFVPPAATRPLSQFVATAETRPLHATTPANDTIAPGVPFCSLILSGPEPQRTMLFERVRGALRGIQLCVLSSTPVKDAGSNDPCITLVINPDTCTMRDLVSRSTAVITRSGYTSVMELVSLGKGAVLIPTPGQTEQEYLGEYLNGHHGFKTVRQSEIACLTRLVKESELMTLSAPPEGVAKVYPIEVYLPDGVGKVDPIEVCLPDSVAKIEANEVYLPDSAPLFEKAIDLLPVRKKCDSGKSVTPEKELLYGQEAW